MKQLQYGFQEVGTKEMAVTISSMMIGVGVLTLPRVLASATQSSDGWISILIAGMLAIMLACVLAKLASLSNNQTFFQFTSQLVSKPIAYVLVSAITIYFIMLTGYEVRAIANISKQYLFTKTPVEVIALAFQLIVIYAVSGTRIGVIRLNVLFLPFVVVITMVVLIFSFPLFKVEHLKPFFITSAAGIWSGVKEALFAMGGFEVVLFYAGMMNRPQLAVKSAWIGVSIPVVMYVLLYIFVIGVFSYETTAQIMFPTIELAKEVEFPGEFFERMESIFFIIWIMTIFNTTCMGFDLCVHTLNSMFARVRKMTWILWLSPLIYLICMLSENMVQFSQMATIISYWGFTVSMLIPALLFLIAKLRGVKSNG